MHKELDKYMIKAAVVGGSGYTGGELARILSRHPNISLEAMTSRQNAGKAVAEVMPFLRGFNDLSFVDKLPNNGDFDIVFLATPHTASMALVPQFIECGVKVVDLSADYRLKDSQTYEKWYAHQHTDVENISKAVYGLPELFRKDISRADLVANPGCYPTCTILSLAPLFQNGLAKGKVIVDAKSGTSGAGQEPTKNTHHPNCGSTINPYKVGTHRHTPEIKEVLSEITGKDIDVIFSPHLLPIVRGMLTTSYVDLAEGVTKEDITMAYKSAYDEEHFIRITSVPAIPAVVGSNFCEVGFEIVGSTLIAMSSLDNLVKGAAGQAVQNANIMFKINETTGLDFPGLGV